MEDKLKDLLSSYIGKPTSIVTSYILINDEELKQILKYLPFNTKLINIPVFIELVEEIILRGLDYLIENIEDMLDIENNELLKDVITDTVSDIVSVFINPDADISYFKLVDEDNETKSHIADVISSIYIRVINQYK